MNATASNDPASYLRSPIVTINVGTGDEATALFAHQALLIQSPYFAQAVSRFKDSSPRVIDLQNDDILATSSVLEWIYKGDYFPTMDAQKSSLEYDPLRPCTGRSRRRPATSRPRLHARATLRAP